MRYDSGITVKALFDQLNGETDIIEAISSDTDLLVYNSTITTLYRDFIRAELLEEIEYDDIGEDGTIDDLDYEAEDIYKIFSDGVELEKTVLSFAIRTLRPVWCVQSNRAVRVFNVFDNVHIVRFERPTIITSVSDNTNHVPLPLDYVELVLCKLRANRYSLAGDDTMSAKWLGEYNAMLEDFARFASTTGNLGG